MAALSIGPFLLRGGYMVHFIAFTFIFRECKNVSVKYILFGHMIMQLINQIKHVNFVKFVIPSCMNIQSNSFYINLLYMN